MKRDDGAAAPQGGGTMGESAMDAKVLRRAAELIDQGWCQGGWSFAEDGAHVDPASSRAVRWCLRGARTRAMREMGLEWCVEDRGTRTLQEILRERGEMAALMIWNDRLDRTADDVAAILREAADRCEARERVGAEGDAPAVRHG